MVFEYRVGWTIGGANTGASVFHGRNDGVISDQDTIEELAARARAFFNALVTYVPLSVDLDFPGEGVEYNTSTGVLEDVYTFTPPADVAPSGSGSYSAVSGGRVEWLTPAIVNGRRLRGRTFVIPTTVGTYDSSGTLSSTFITALDNAAADFYDQSVLTDCAPCIWSRTHGILADITAHSIPDEASYLRSRRD